jgi:hypothetical protein
MFSDFSKDTFANGSIIEAATAPAKVTEVMTIKAK